VTPRRLEQFLAAEREWRHENEALVRDFRFRDFDEGLRFVDYVARRAIDYFRRPDICISSNRVQLSISNRHHAGITLAELRLAAKVNAAVDGLRVDR
jgi:pterin-4a-carbinolamine dehydratase